MTFEHASSPLRRLAVPLLTLGLEAYVVTVWFLQVDHGVWRLHHVIGLVLLVPSSLLWMLARYQLGDAFTPRAEARTLVTRGLYRRIRNPIYVFAELITVGLVAFSGWWIFLLVLLVTVPVQVRRARREARVLDAAFGEQYRAYARKTWF